jgi:FKBP-type peptidyl-prolyl cis-trans isomerase FkpA
LSSYRRYCLIKRISVKKIVYPLSLLFLLFSGVSCLKDSTACSPNSPASETNQMNAYCAGNGITPTIHPTGLFYQIINPGSGPTASANSTIFITYVGKLEDGTVFDQQANSALTGWPLNQLIEGWRIGIPLIQKGGQIKLVVPSSMAYGCSGYGTIPGDAILFFDITLVNVQ